MKVITVQVGSYIHDSTQIWFTGSFGHDIENQRAQQYELTAKELEINDTFIIHANRFDIIGNQTPSLLCRIVDITIIEL